jgi:hypothetical protein
MAVTSLPKLMFGFFAGPMAWLIDLEASYALVPWACAHHRRDVLFMIPAGALGLIAIGAWVCWSTLSTLRSESARSTFGGATINDRNGFIAWLGLLMHVTFAILILTTFAGRSLLSPCD